MLQEIFRVISRFPRYILCYISENQLPLDSATLFTPAAILLLRHAFKRINCLVCNQFYADLPPPWRRERVEKTIGEFSLILKFSDFSPQLLHLYYIFYSI